jgi:hypothetical protein
VLGGITPVANWEQYAAAKNLADKLWTDYAADIEFDRKSN